jgi:hypothetical protein
MSGSAGLYRGNSDRIADADADADTNPAAAAALASLLLRTSVVADD